jgi:hypothetical protein
MEWINTVLGLAEKCQRRGVVLSTIGKILAYGPKMSDGDKKPIIPTFEVAEILQELNDDKIDREFSSALFNKRGVTSRGAFDGGEQERELASRYGQGGVDMQQYPRMQAILYSLKNRYEYDANRCDLDAENSINTTYKI